MIDLCTFRFSSKDSGQRRENNERLLKADYHGCYIVVRRSKCASLLGQAGIVLMETKNMFKVIAKDKKIKCKCLSVLNFLNEILCILVNTACMYEEISFHRSSCFFVHS